ncbi:MAG: hypothetical protein M1431_00790 [Candidatus Thermoplasmatota archaeon]|nr:hypothetical protein [Candidatus Thermoplasmatota archaeon]
MEIIEKEQNGDEPVDEMELVIGKIGKEAESILSMLEILEKLEQAGIIKLLKNISRSYLPTDVEFFGKFVSSKEFANGIMKLANTLVPVLYALSDERTSDIVKAILYNMPDISKDIVDTVTSGKKQTMLTMYSEIKNERDFFNLITALLKALSRISKSIKELDYSDPLEKMK